MEIPVPNVYIVTDCSKCCKRHAPIRECEKPVTVNLSEVIDGLSIGKSFKRPLDGSEGFEYVHSLNEFKFTHTVAGSNEYGGYGGVADLTMDTLRNGCWHSEGWIPE